MSRRNAELGPLVRRKASHIIWTHCMLHRLALASRNMSKELHTVFQAVITVVSLSKSVH